MQVNVITLVLHPDPGPLPEVLSAFFWIIGLKGAREIMSDQALHRWFPRALQKVEGSGPGQLPLVQRRRLTPGEPGCIDLLLIFYIDLSSNRHVELLKSGRLNQRSP